ncbi:MAG: cobalamin-dependent protein, partial [Nitrospinota bacterium]
MFYQQEVFQNFVKRLEAKLEKWKGEKILLYGAGEHSRQVLNRVRFSGVDFLGFVDRAPTMQQKEFLGYSVFSPEKCGELTAARVVISSFSFQEEIFEALSNLSLNGTEIVRLYTEQDLVLFIKKAYAHAPCEDSVRPGFLKKKDDFILPGASKGSPKILLIQPPFPFANRRHKKILPMNLLYLAAYTQKTNPDAAVRILDGQVNDLSMSELKEIIQQEPWDIIGLGYWTAQAETVFELSRFIWEKTKSLLVHGGVHPSLCPEDAQKHCDLMVLNEGEETFSEIVQKFSAGEDFMSVHGIAFDDNGKLIRTPSRPPVKNLDTFPLPSFDLIPDMGIYNS